MSRMKNLPKDHGAIVAIGAVGVLAAIGSVASHPDVRRGTFNQSAPSTRGKWVELSFSRGEATPQQSRGMYNDPIVLKVKPKGIKKAKVRLKGHVRTNVLGTIRVLPGSGSQDSIAVFQNDDYLYVLSYSTRMGYVGLRKYLITEPLGTQYEAVESGEMFLQDDESIREVLGKRGLDLSERNMVKRLSEYIY